jgi:hypothetical protein
MPLGVEREAAAQPLILAALLTTSLARKPAMI